jgi:glucokinase
MILGGDLGGTKTLLALADADGRIVRSRRYVSADYADFGDLLGDFLVGERGIAAACFGIAGPTDGQTAKLTYLPWQLSAADLGRRYGIAQVRLVNDFAAAAHGLPQVAPEHLVTVQAGQPDAAAPRLILGAGTGLGVAGLLPENDGVSAFSAQAHPLFPSPLAGEGAPAGRERGKPPLSPGSSPAREEGGEKHCTPSEECVHLNQNRFRVVPGEGGHFGFAPQTPEQGELWRWLLAQHGRVTTEDIVSGPGLAHIYAFLGGQSAKPATTSEATPETIGEIILRSDNDNAYDARASALAHSALQLWLSCLGAFAGDLALHWLARGGVYLAGGVIARLLPHVDHAPLVTAFRAKREHADLMPAMPLYVVTDHELGLRGALVLASASCR